ncbi:hypothetical protein SAMN04488542_1365 [Fontibacillus panacisegetis]|uniref:Uncharacterized protein n=1 Tax=Fontibacillus panacisegetis TaxID=670482 RepID=A0A1G7TCH7_9BACL|nr:hypothetical protein [Fontibacillus panacisegetis]SDG32744.1 hypothetical protein SAMN04488542_1365 [Fontibacillus panacisegetis]
MFKAKFPKSKRTFLSVFAVGVLFFTTMNVHSYAESEKKLGKITEGNYVVSTSVDDETGLPSSGLPTYYQGTPGMVQPYLASGNIIWNDAGYYGSSYVVDKAISEGESIASRLFVKYLTSSWAKAASYTWGTSNSAAWTYSGSATFDIANKVKVQLGLSTTRTTTYSVAINIPADSSRFSKLGFASDYFTQYYYWTKTVDGTLVDSEHEYIRTPLADSYLIVYYQ